MVGRLAFLVGDIPDGESSEVFLLPLRREDQLFGIDALAGADRVSEGETA